MDLEEFLQLSIRVASSAPLAEYSPTFVFPASGAVQPIVGIPNDVDHREAIQHCITPEMLAEEFLFAVRSGPTEITAGHHQPGEDVQFAAATFAADEITSGPIPRPGWWTLGA